MDELNLKHVTITQCNNGYLVIPDRAEINRQGSTLLVAEYYVFETRKSLVKWLSKNLAIPSGFVGIMKEHIKG